MNTRTACPRAIPRNDGGAKPAWPPAMLLVGPALTGLRRDRNVAGSGLRDLPAAIAAASGVALGDKS